MKSTNMSDLVAVAGVISPQNSGGGDASTGWIAMADFASLMAIVQVGTLSSGGTVDASFEQATASDGSGLKAVANSSVTQLVKATNDDDQVVIDLSEDELDANNGYCFARLKVSVGTGGQVSGVVLGGSARFGPARNLNLPSVVQVREAGVALSGVEEA